MLSVCNFIRQTEPVGDNGEVTLFPHEYQALQSVPQKIQKAKYNAIAFLFFFFMLIRLKFGGCGEGLALKR